MQVEIPLFAFLKAIRVAFDDKSHAHDIERCRKGRGRSVRKRTNVERNDTLNHL